MHKKRFLTSSGLIVAVLVFSIMPPVQIAQATSGVMFDLSATLSTLKINTDANQEIMFTLSTEGNGLASGETIILTYDSDFVTTDVVFTDLDVSSDPTPDADCTSGETDLPLVAGAAVTTSMGFVNTSSTVLTLENGTVAIAAGAEICIQIGTNAAGPGVNMILNPTTVDSFNLALTGTIGAGSPETGTMVITTVTDPVVVTTATVVASLTFTVDGDQTMGFGTLLTTSARWANTTSGAGSTEVAHTMTAGTNSTSGYTVTYNGTALVSGGDKISDTGDTTISGDADGEPGTEEFAISVTVSDNAGIASGYENGSNNFKFVESVTTTLVSETIASAAETISVYYIANIAPNTEAHTDYTSSITYTATGNF